MAVNKLYTHEEMGERVDLDLNNAPFWMRYQQFQPPLPFERHPTAEGLPVFNLRNRYLRNKAPDSGAFRENTLTDNYAYWAKIAGMRHRRETQGFRPTMEENRRVSRTLIQPSFYNNVLGQDWNQYTDSNITYAPRATFEDWRQENELMAYLR